MGDNKREFFIGIDLGGRNKKTTAFCVLERREKGIFPAELCCKKCETYFGKDIFKKIKPYLSSARVIAIDAPLTIGRGKGKMRLYEKFLSQKIFREEKVNPLPPALMRDFSSFSQELRREFESRGFVSDVNLIEVFPALAKKAVADNFVLNFLKKTCQSEDQKSASFCAILAYLHSILKTRYLGYKDGFLFLPEMSFWNQKWKDVFHRAWQEKPYLHYRRLITNLF
ncbi:MAG: DUF429 domain-containing protein [bacterium]|nr:DUF429 domain-containing protein [bacterium]